MKNLVSSMVLLSSVGLGISYSLAADKQPSPPSQSAANDFDKYEKVVWRYFKSQENYQPSDLIVREDAEVVLKQLATAGFTLKKPNDLLKLLLAKSDFLSTELYTPAGRKFMQRIASFPLGYDRLDRLSWLPRGKQTVHDLIRGPGGEKMIQYMTTASGGKELGKQLSQGPNGGGFNDPTGRIYTAASLIDYLKKQYDIQLKAATSTAKT
jgi:hypothetical protein